MPSEIKEVNTTVSGLDGGPIMVEFVAALKRIYDQPLPAEVVDLEPAPATPPSSINPPPSTSLSVPATASPTGLPDAPATLKPASIAGPPQFEI